MNWDWMKGLADFLKKPRKISLEDIAKAMEVAENIHGWLREILPIGRDVVQEMSYTRAISYFVEQRPKDGRVAKGAMLLQEHPQGKLLTQVFLDKNNDLISNERGKPFGRRLILRSMDAELKETFGGKDLVIVE